MPLLPLLMNLRQRCQAVFQAGYKVGEQSFRSLAAATKLSKSSVHRLYHRLRRRNQYPESQLWETQAGQQWLRLLVFAALFVFALEGGIGCERLSEFFHLLRLQQHIGVSQACLTPVKNPHGRENSRVSTTCSISIETRRSRSRALCSSR